MDKSGSMSDALLSQLNSQGGILSNPSQAGRVLNNAGLMNKAIAAAVSKFQHAYIDGDETYQQMTMRQVAEVVLSQMMDHMEHVTDEQWKSQQIEAWQTTLLGKAGPQYKDIDKFRMTVVRWGDPKSKWAPVGTAPRIIEMEMEEVQMNSMRFARGIQIPLDALFTEQGLKWTLEGIAHLLQGALVSQALVTTAELIGQTFYEVARLKRCETVASYESLLERMDDLRFPYNKYDDPQITLEQEAAADMAPYTSSGPDTWILPADVLAFAKHKLRANRQFYETGRKLDYANHETGPTIQKVDSTLGSPSGSYYALPNNFIKDSPLMFKVSEGSAWALGQNPEISPLQLTSPNKFDCKHYCKGTDSYETLSYLKCLETLQGVFWGKDGNIVGQDDNARNVNAYHPDDGKEDPFTYWVDGTTSRPIQFYGQYNVKNSQIFVRHAQSLIEQALKRVGKTVAECNKAFANWLAFVDKSDAVPFDELSVLDDAAFTTPIEQEGAYKLRYAKRSSAAPNFAGSYYQLRKHAESGSQQTIAEEFLTCMRALIAGTDNIHECLITDANSCSPEQADHSKEAAFYSQCMAAMHMDHYNLFHLHATDTTTKSIGESVIRPLTAIYSPTPTWATEISKLLTTIQHVDTLRAIVAALVAIHQVHNTAPDFKDAIAKLDVSKLNVDHALALLTDATRVAVSKDAPAALKSFELQLAAAKHGGVKKLSDNKMYVMTDVAIPKYRYAEFVKWLHKENVKSTTAKSPETAPWQIQQLQGKNTTDTTGVGFVAMQGSTEKDAEAYKIDDDDMSVNTAAYPSRHHPSDKKPALTPNVDLTTYTKFRKNIAEIIGTDAYKQHYQNLFIYSTSEAEKWVAFAVLMSRFNLNSVRNSVLNSCVPMMNLLVTALAITYRSSATVGLKRGSQTGLVNITQRDFRFSISAPVKYMLGHLSYKIGVWITNPKNVWTWIGAYCYGVMSGGRGGNDQLSVNIENIKHGAKDLLVLPLSSDDWPLARHYSIIGRYPQLDTHSDNRCSTAISTGYRINRMHNLYTSGRKNALRTIVSPGAAYYMNEAGRFEIRQNDRGIFGELADVGLHKRFMGIHSLKEHD